MSDERKRILTMLAEGKINVNEAERLLAALSGSGATASGSSSDAGPKRRYLRVEVDEGKDGDKVDIRVPLSLLRAGIRMGALIGTAAEGKLQAKLENKGLNIDLAKIGHDQIEELIQALAELEVNIDEKKEKVRIYCE